MSAKDARFHLAWLIWCYNEGYVKAEDRVDNWLLHRPATLNHDDLRLRKDLLVMADEVLTAFRKGK